MIGRVELISDEQRALLDRLSQAAISEPDWISKIWESPNAQSFLTGHSEFDDLGVTVPPDYQMYLALGRFRNALVTARLCEQPTDSLRKFVSTYQLEQFKVPGDTALTSQPAGSRRRRVAFREILLKFRVTTVSSAETTTDNTDLHGFG